MEYITALITPFDDYGNINKKSLVQLCEKTISEGATGLFVGGSVGECFLLSIKERMELFETVSQYKDKVTIHAHVGSLSTTDAITMGKEASKLGINKIASTPPFYYSYTGSEIGTYFHELSDAIGDSVLYYDIPMATKYRLDFSDNNINELFRSKCIDSIKHTNVDTSNLKQIRLLNPDFKIYGGLESNLYKLLSFDCSGFIGSTFNFMLPEFQRILDYNSVKRTDLVMRSMADVSTIITILLRIGLHASAKYLVGKQGIEVGVPRSPLKDLSEAERLELDNILKLNLFN